MRRRWVTVSVAAASAFVAVYVPHVIRVGSKVIGFLPGYLQQEGYTKGTRFGIIGLFVTGPLAIAVAALILAAVAFAVLQFSDPDRPWQGALYMTAAALAVATPHYQWYSLLLVMLVALDGRPEWLAFAAGGYYAAYPNLGRYTPPWRLEDAIAYGVPLMVVGTMRLGIVGSGSSFSRNRRTCTVTVDVSPNVQLHTSVSSCSLVKALRGFRIRKTSRSYSREVSWISLPSALTSCAERSTTRSPSVMAPRSSLSGRPAPRDLRSTERTRRASSRGLKGLVT